MTPECGYVFSRKQTLHIHLTTIRDVICQVSSYLTSLRDTFCDTDKDEAMSSWFLFLKIQWKAAVH